MYILPIYFDNLFENIHLKIIQLYKIMKGDQDSTLRSSWIKETQTYVKLTIDKFLIYKKNSDFRRLTLACLKNFNKRMKKHLLNNEFNCLQTVIPDITSSILTTTTSENLNAFFIHLLLDIIFQNSITDQTIQQLIIWPNNKAYH